MLRLSLVIFLIWFLTQWLVMCQDAEKKEITSTRQIRQFSEVSQDWMKEILNVNKELLNVQAIIAKDEESTTNCTTGSRKTNKRHLMCVGSIVNFQHVLTSATCIQEATYIRHNLRAPLVVVVGVLKLKPQVIRVDNYKIHPQHIVFPYDPQHSKHNIAVIKLSCRIANEHFTAIELPQAPFTELCTNENCLVAIIRKVGETSHVIYDTWAKHIPTSTRKRRSTETTIELQNNSTLKILSANIEEKLRKSLKTQHPRSLKLQDILSNQALGPYKIEKPISAKNEKTNFLQREQFGAVTHEDLPFDKLGSMISGRRDSVNVETIKNVAPRIQSNSTLKSNTSIGEKSNESLIADAISTAGLIEENTLQIVSAKNDKGRIFSARASDGFQGCPQTGSPVMYGQIQAALVSVSCDDRQPSTVWKYTDLFTNMDWIIKESGILAKTSKSLLNGTSTCNTCIYNFFIDLTASNDNATCTELDRINTRSPNHEFCVSHYGKDVKNNLRSIDKSSFVSGNNKKFPKSNQNSVKALNSSLASGKYENLQNRQFIEKKRTNYKADSSKNYKSDTSKNYKSHSPKDYRKKLAQNVEKKFPESIESLESRKNSEKAKNRDFTGVPKIDVELRSNRNFAKIVKNSQKGVKMDLNKNNDERMKTDLGGDYHGKIMETRKENRLKKQIENERVLKNEPRVLDTPRTKASNSQQSIEYNPLTQQKFHNLRLLLARLQNFTPRKESQNGKPIKNLSYEKFLNSLHGIKYVKKENIPPILDKQYITIISR